MSTEDDRSRSAGGYSDSGLFTPSDQRDYQPDYSQTDSGSILPGGGAADEYDEPVKERKPVGWHVGADLGLLVLRVTLGALFVGHGLQKVFGIMQGPGIDGFAKTLEGFGFEQTTLLAWVTGVTELGAGGLLILGLFTPAAAAGILGVMANAIWVRVNTAEFAGAVELEIIYAAAAFALLFTGAGRVSLDRNTPWFRAAPAFGFVFLILAAGLSVVTLVVLRN